MPLSEEEKQRNRDWVTAYDASLRRRQAEKEVRQQKMEGAQILFEQLDDVLVSSFDQPNHQDAQILPFPSPKPKPDS